MQTAAQVKIISLLRNEFLTRKIKNDRYSLRSFSRHTGIQAPILCQLFSGKRTLTPALAHQVLASIKSVDGETKFQLISQISTRKTPTENPNGEHLLRYIQLSASEYSLLSEWHHFAILSLIDSGWKTNDPEQISNHFFGVKPNQVKKSLELLEKLGMIDISRHGLRSTGKKFTTSTDISSETIRAFHREGLDLARDALEVDPTQRDFSAITVTCNPKALAKIKTKIQKLRREISNSMEKTKGKTVYRFQIQLFPLSKYEESSHA